MKTDIPTLAATLLRLKRDRQAVTAIEYGIIAALIVVAIIVAVQTTGTSLSSTFVSIGSTI